MKNIKVDGNDYILLSQRELDVLLNDARSMAHVDDSPSYILQNGDLSPTESRFIEYLRENVKTYEKIVAVQSSMDGMAVSFFRFHSRDIG